MLIWYNSLGPCFVLQAVCGYERFVITFFRKEWECEGVKLLAVPQENRATLALPLRNFVTLFRPLLIITYMKISIVVHIHSKKK